MFGEITLKFLLNETNNYEANRDALFEQFSVEFLRFGRRTLVTRGFVHPAQVVVHFLEARVVSAQSG
jgi:hypothetical protein